MFADLAISLSLAKAPILARSTPNSSHNISVSCSWFYGTSKAADVFEVLPSFHLSLCDGTASALLWRSSVMIYAVNKLCTSISFQVIHSPSLQSCIIGVVFNPAHVMGCKAAEPLLMVVSMMHAALTPESHAH